jgi:hypothetical protein
MTADGEMLLTVFLKHRQSLNLAEINQKLEQTGFWQKFPPDAVEVVSWYVMMGIGQVVTLRLPAEKLRAVNLAIVAGHQNPRARRLSRVRGLTATGTIQQRLLGSRRQSRIEPEGLGRDHPDIRHARMGRVEHRVPLLRHDDRRRDQDQGLGALQPSITGPLIPCTAVLA